MAKIEMDISEYEEMKKNTALLEDALKRERLLSEKIDKLNEEKIQVMEANAKSVTIVEEQSINQIIMTKKSNQEILTFLSNIKRNYDNYMKNQHLYAGTSDNGTSAFVDYVIENLFERKEMRTVPQELKKVYHKGLDDVKQEIYQHLKDEYDKDILKKLDNLDELGKSNSELKSENRRLKNDFKVVNGINETQSDEIEVLKKKVESLGIISLKHKLFLDLLDEHTPMLLELSKRNINIFNYGEYKTIMKSAVNDFLDKLYKILATENESNT